MELVVAGHHDRAGDDIATRLTRLTKLNPIVAFAVKCAVFFEVPVVQRLITNGTTNQRIEYIIKYKLEDNWVLIERIVSTEEFREMTFRYSQQLLAKLSLILLSTIDCRTDRLIAPYGRLLADCMANSSPHPIMSYQSTPIRQQFHSNSVQWELYWK